MEKNFEISKEFREIEFGSMIDKALSAWYFIKQIMRKLGFDLQK